MIRLVCPECGEEVGSERLDAWYAKATVWYKAYYAWSRLAQVWYWKVLAWCDGQPWPGSHPPYTPGGWQLEPPPTPPDE